MTTTDRHEQLIEFTDATGTRRRLRFVPHQSGDWWRIDEEWTGCQWRHVGREIVSDLTITQRQPDEIHD